MSQIDRREKTLVFCATLEHALAVRDLINQMTTSTDPNHCQRETANDDLLVNVASALGPLTREERAAGAKTLISSRFNGKQQALLDFVMSHYISIGVE
jgi:hypothetical protein